MKEITKCGVYQSWNFFIGRYEQKYICLCNTTACKHEKEYVIKYVTQA